MNEEMQLDIQTIYEKPWKREKCIRIGEKQVCVEVSASIKIFKDNDSVKIKFTVLDKSKTYDLLNTCYPSFESGIGRLKVCTQDIRMVGCQLQAVTLSANLYAETAILEHKLEKRWEIVNTRLTFAYIPGRMLSSFIDPAYKVDKLIDTYPISQDLEVAITLDDDDFEGVESYVIPSFARPSFSTLNNNYTEVIHDCPDISTSPNQCAVRLSRALIATGIAMDSDYEGNLCRHGYARGAQDLGAFLKNKWGVRDYGFEAPNSVPSQMNGKKGVILFANIPNFNGQGHIDLWDGSATRTGIYWNANPIWFWELPS